MIQNKRETIEDIRNIALNCKENDDKEQWLEKFIYLVYEQIVEPLQEQLKNLDWYKMWHYKFRKDIDDLTLELETYRPTKLHGNGQCKCANCGTIHWTDWCSRYKGQTFCDKCLKEILEKEKEDTSDEEIHT